MAGSDNHMPEFASAAQIGAYLRAARVAAGMSVAQMSETTRITKAHIEALEEGDFDMLPGIAYTPGFIRNYCLVLKLDPAMPVSAYKTISMPEQKKPEYRFPVQALVPKMAGSMVAMVAVIVLLAGYIGWSLVSEDEGNITQTAALEESHNDLDQLRQIEAAQSGALVTEPETQTAPVLAGAATQLADAPIPDELPGADVLLAPQGSGMGAAPDTDVAQTAPALPVLPNTDDQIQSAAVTQNSPVPAAPKPADAVNAVAVPRRPQSEVIIFATATSWVEIARADGEVIISKLLKNGDRLVTSAEDNLFLSTGNAGGLTLAFGEDAAPRQLGTVGEIIRDLSLSPDSLVVSQ